MDIRAYIQSGIIESYVLGLANAEECAEVEKLRVQYSEIEEAINDFSIALEEKAFENAVTPPPALKAKIISAIKKEEDFNGELFVVKRNDPKPIEQTPVQPDQTIRWRNIAVAAIILFVASTATNYYLYSQYSNNKEAYQALLSERETLQANNEIYQTQLKEWQSAASMIADSGMAMVKMRSTNGNSDAATVFWDTNSKDVYVMVNKLPEPKSGKQYQLWAMVDGKPVDAGVLDPACSSVCKMKNIPKAQAFAITLEKEGGNRAPTLKALYVMGRV